MPSSWSLPHPPAEWRGLQGPRGVQSHKTKEPESLSEHRWKGASLEAPVLDMKWERVIVLSHWESRFIVNNSYPSLNHHIQRPNYDQALRSLELDLRYLWEPREQEFLGFFSGAMWLIWLTYNLIFVFLLASLTFIWLPSTFLYFCPWLSYSLLIVLVSFWLQLAPGPS